MWGGSPAAVQMETGVESADLLSVTSSSELDGSEVQSSREDASTNFQDSSFDEEDSSDLANISESIFTSSTVNM